MTSWLGLRARLVLLVLLALLPVFGLFAYSAAKNRQAAVAQAQANLQSEAFLAALHQQRLAERVAQLLGDIASGPSIKDTRNSLCVQYLKNLKSQDANYLDLGVVGLDGHISCHALDLGLGAFAGDRRFFKQILAGQKISVGEYAVGRFSGRPGIPFGVPVYDAQAVLNGVAYAAVDITALTTALAAGEILDGARLRVIDRRGMVLATRPPSKGVVGTQEQDAIVRDAALAGQSGVREAADTAGVARIYAYAPVGGVAAGELFVAISVPSEMITAGPRELLQIELSALLAMTAFGVALAWWLGKRLIVSPARAILSQANEVIRGNLAARVGSGSLYRDEIGEIGRAFNHMAASLQTRRDELDAALNHAEQERILLDLILNSMSEGVIAIDTDRRFLLLNASARKLYQYAPGTGSSLDDWRSANELMLPDGKTACELAKRPLMQALQGASVDNWVGLFRRPGVEDRVLRINARPLRDANGQLVGGVAVTSDISELKIAEDFAAAQQQVLTLIAAGVPLPQSLEAIVRLIEKSSPASHCLILLNQDQQLRHGAAASLPASFVQAIDGLPVCEGMGACGTAAFRKARVVVEDIERDPLMQNFRGLLQAHELRACWSMPVTSTDGEVLATFAIYRRTPGKPLPKDEELMDTASRLARIALERTRAEAALVSSEARFRELAENIDDVFYSADARTGRLLYVSPGYQRIWGLSCESLYADPASFAHVAVAADRHLVTLNHQRNRAGERSEVEYRILTPDGQTRWIRHHSYPVFNANGELERVVGTARDISASKLADLALARTNRALQILSRSSISINRMNDEESLLAEVCRIAVDVGGYRMAWVGYAQDDEAHSIQVAAHAGDESGYLTSIALSWRADLATSQGLAGRAIRSGQPVQIGDISSAGDFFWREAALKRGYRSCIGLPLRGEQLSFGVLCLYASEAQDFSPDEVRLLQELADNLAFGIGSLRARQEHARSQEAARQAALKLREQASLMDQAQDAIMVRNLDGTLRFWNKGAERLFGWTADEVLGKTMRTEMYARPQTLSLIREQIMGSEHLWTGQLEKLARDGSIVAVEARWSVVHDEQGRVNGMLGINTDMRERKLAHEQIMLLNASLEGRVKRRTAQLESANQQLEAFSYSVSHDLRSPLSAIAGFSTLLDKAMAAGDPQTGRSQHYLTRIRAGVAQMGELIDAMLSLAQVSRSSMRWEAVDLSALSEALLAGYEERDPTRETRLRVESGLLAHGDPRLLRQVLDNLLGNAWKFTQGKHPTEITVAHQTGSAGETVYFVRDNGAGFDMTYAEKLFGAFQRLHTESEFAGTGIGLATVQRIVARHGGRIWGESVKGKGATFYFTLGQAMA